MSYLIEWKIWLCYITDSAVFIKHYIINCFIQAFLYFDLNSLTTHLLTMWCISEWYKIFNRKNVGRSLVFTGFDWLDQENWPFQKEQELNFLYWFFTYIWSMHCIVLCLKVEGNVILMFCQHIHFFLFSHRY